MVTFLFIKMSNNYEKAQNKFKSGGSEFYSVKFYELRFIVKSPPRVIKHFLHQGDGEGQGSLVCCGPWGRKESDMTEQQQQILIYTIKVASVLAQVFFKKMK